ncbi:transposase [Streptomyces subrutilus]|uniref:Transposase n=1 Tax=Streptomyces subrutilus TaxID=36818 RepID=A0A1E5PKP9_9ACTN|nr:transposase [Streptomyces subrutilus]OEJ30115.1 hypothetical protein BGK67_00865 [Streptomyces subrutilus]
MSPVGPCVGGGVLRWGRGNVRAYVSRNLRGKPQQVDPRRPTARAVTRWILTHPDALAERYQLQLKTVLASCPELDALTASVRSFATPGTRLDAVTAGLSQPWNSGVVEGHVNRIKMLKRQMFGRVGFELLRKRGLSYS